MGSRLFAVIVFATTVVFIMGSSIMEWLAGLPLWLLWSLLIASGNAVYTKVIHNSQTETISLMMAMVLLAIMNLTWPEIAAATIVGVGIGEVFRSKPWYKKMYSIAAISIAAILTEIMYSNGMFASILITAIVMDAILQVAYTPIWLFVAKEHPLDMIANYLNTFWTAPLSAIIASIINRASDYDYGILLICAALILLLRPRYVIGRVTVPA